MKKEENWALKSLSGPLMISWDITNKCNFHCRHCLNCSNDNNKHDYDDELTSQEKKDVVKQILDVRPYSICICGGEPTLSNDLFYIIKKLSDAGIQVNMVSNGFLIDEKFAIKLEECGLSFIQISVDSYIPEQHDEFRSKKNSFIKATNALKFLSKTRIRTAASMAPTKFNIEWFGNYVNLIKSLGCKHIRLMPLLPMGRGFYQFEEIEPNAEQYFYFKNEIMRIKKNNMDMIIEWGDPLEHIYLARYMPRSEPIVMEIRANGDIAPSIYLPVSCGNLKKYTIKDYWFAGFNNIWSNKYVKNLAEGITTIEDFKDMSHRTWNIKRVHFDLVEERL